MEDINNYNYQINSRLEHFKRQLEEIERIIKLEYRYRLLNLIKYNY